MAGKKYVYVFAVGGMPDPILHPRRATRTIAWMKANLDGLITIVPVDRHKTFLAFPSYIMAMVARNRFIVTGNDAGRDVYLAELDEEKSRIEILHPAE